MFDFSTYRERDQRITSVHFAENEREFNISIRQYVEDLEQSYK